MPIDCTIKGCGNKQEKIKSMQKIHLTLHKLKSHFTGELSHKFQRYNVLVIPFINKISICIQYVLPCKH